MGFSMIVMPSLTDNISHLFLEQFFMVKACSKKVAVTASDR